MVLWLMFAGKTQQFVVLPCMLLDCVRKGAKTSSKGEKRKIDKEHCIQVRLAALQQGH